MSNDIDVKTGLDDGTGTVDIYDKEEIIISIEDDENIQSEYREYDVIQVNMEDNVTSWSSIYGDPGDNTNLRDFTGEEIQNYVDPKVEELNNAINNKLSADNLIPGINVFFKNEGDNIVISAAGGGGGSENNYELLNNKPKLGGITVEYDYPLDHYNIASTEEINYTNNEGAYIDVGGIKKDTIFTDDSIKSMFDQLIYPNLTPELTDPFSTLSISTPELLEVGDVVDIVFNATLDRGSITPSYGTDGYRSGLPSKYTFNGTGITQEIESTETSIDVELFGYVVQEGIQLWESLVSYSEGPQPKTIKGDDFDTPLPQGDTDASQVYINGVFPNFATTNSVLSSDKLELVNNEVEYIEVTLAPEIGGKQSIEINDRLNKITGVKFYNELSRDWDWVCGSSENSLTTWNLESVQRDVNGRTINYNKYVNNTVTVGSRQLRFYVK